MTDTIGLVRRVGYQHREPTSYRQPGSDSLELFILSPSVLGGEVGSIIRYQQHGGEEHSRDFPFNTQ